MDVEQIRELIKEMTLEEKAGLTSGRDNWFTKAVERLGVPQVRTSDGPHGLRTQKGETNSLAEGASAKAVCFPAACATAASFDRELLRRMGEALGRECQALGVNVLLGPGVNIKRSPLCGRKFPQEFSGNFGLMTLHGIRKPVYHAFELLRQVGDTRIEIHTSEGGIEAGAFENEEGIQVLLYRLDLKCRNLPKETAEVEIIYEQPFSYVDGKVFLTVMLDVNDVFLIKTYRRKRFERPRKRTDRSKE